jgi:hypothetical protein
MLDNLRANLTGWTCELLQYPHVCFNGNEMPNIKSVIRPERSSGTAHTH